MARKYPLPSPIFDTLNNVLENSYVLSDIKLPFANNDLKIALEFLKQYDGNKSTFNCYRKEIERLIQWAWLLQEKSIINLKREDLEIYIKFCMKPPKSWIGLKIVSKFRTVDGDRVANPAWRPFIEKISKAKYKDGDIPSKESYHLSQKTIQEIFVALGSFYNYIVAQNYSEQNPVAAIKQKSKFIRKNQSSATIRRLSDIQWQAVVNAAKDMASKDPIKHERTLFVISALYLMYLRVSELVKSERWSPQMNHFFQDSYQNWWFKTVGKGNKERKIAVNDDMLCALARWRKYLNLSPALPSPDDNSPLVPKLRGNDNVTDTKMIYLIVQNCFNNTIDSLNKNNQTEEADNLLQASSHWLRHTGISDAINKFERPIAHVRDDAGHASSATTDRYNDITLLERHASARKGKLEH
ncbi:MAG: site-specific integrase [Rickettsiaceae bacterium]|nr:site-specific integrase [Rickettsiaceae bacterium]